MYSTFCIASEFDAIEPDIDPNHRRSAAIKYRSLRLTGHGLAYAREVVLARWGW